MGDTEAEESRRALCVGRVRGGANRRSRAVGKVLEITLLLSMGLLGAACKEESAPSTPEPEPARPAVNRSPYASERIPDLTLRVNVQFGFSGYGAFVDPDDDPLSFSASSSRSDIASVRVDRDTISVETHRPGSTTVSVTARDPRGRSASQRFSVTVVR